MRVWTIAVARQNEVIGTRHADGDDCSQRDHRGEAM
jgi:hypothetical protein